MAGTRKVKRGRIAPGGLAGFAPSDRHEKDDAEGRHPALIARMAPLSFTSLAVCAAILGSCGSPPTEDQPWTNGERFFIREVKPILERNCLQCHAGQGAMQSKPNLSNRQMAFAHPGTKPLIVPGKPDASLLIEASSRKGLHARLMPRGDLSLTDDEIGVLREWITDGAAWPTGEAGELRAKPNPER